MPTNLDPENHPFELDRPVRGPASRATPEHDENVSGKLLDALEADHCLHRDAENRLAWKYPGLARLWTIRRGP